MRFYERQFITRKVVNRDILTKFENELDGYFEGDTAAVNGLPTVKYFAEKCFLSPNYFGDSSSARRDARRRSIYRTRLWTWQRTNCWHKKDNQRDKLRSGLPVFAAL